MNTHSFNEIEAKLHMTMDSLSNGEAVFIDDAWIEEAGEAYKAALRKQLNDKEVRTFGLRMSNLGRPLCQLQSEQEGHPKVRKDYNHIVRMMIGDATEIAMTILIKAAGLNITNSKQKHKLNVGGEVVPGEDDIEIDGQIWDIKSASPWSFANKFSKGWNEVYYSDTFGYVAQLWGYADKDPDKMGGWIVVDKSSGEVKAVPAEPTVDQLNEIASKAETTVSTIAYKLPFKKCFEPEEETFYKKPTGNTLVPMVCTFCDYIKTCWPDAQLKSKAMSKAQNPKPVWYTKYTKEVVND
jgi:hypothetical protein